LKIIKRNGKIEEFFTDKIVNAITKAMDETEKGIDFQLALQIAQTIQKSYIQIFPTVEDVQDDIEELLAKNDRFDVAKRYVLYREERHTLRNKGWEMTDLQRDIYEQKYRYEKEDFNGFITRVSGGNDDIGKAIRNKDFIFAGRILAGRGLDRNVTLSNCYVLPQPEDNLESIFDTAKEMARTYSYGGGVGLDISLLRQKGAKVNNSALTTSGAVSFMDLYSMTTGLIGQKGRRGALMVSMDVDHPDIMDFINVKRDLDKVTSANISVRFNDKFFQNIDDEKNSKIFHEVAVTNWESGEAGALFWNKVQSYHMLQYHPLYRLFSTNPCGEQPLPPYGSCLLGSINISNFVIDPFTKHAKIDYSRLSKMVRIAVKGLNEVLDDGMELHPLQQQKDVATMFRQIGLGIMGLADAFIKLGIGYGTFESRVISNKLGQTIADNAILESVELAKINGSYPEFDIKIVEKSDFFFNLPMGIQDQIRQYGMRNSHILSIAPTGSISTMWGISGGIEPIFATHYTRTTQSLGEEDMDYKVYTPIIKELMEHLKITEVGDLPDYTITSHDIKPINRIKLQSIWQEYVDSAISSTINLKEETTVDEIKEIYLEGWKWGLKGMTIFRNNCLRKGILTTEKPKEIEECST